MSRTDELKQSINEHKEELKKLNLTSPYRAWYEEAIEKLEINLKANI